MLWCLASDELKNSLGLETIAVYLRREDPEKYKDARYLLIRDEKEHVENIYVVLHNNEDWIYNTNSHFVKLNVEDEVKLNFECVLNEIEYLKSGAKTTFSQLGGEEALKEINKKFNFNFKTKPLGSFFQRGGLLLSNLDDDEFKIKISLTKSDLYKIFFYRKGKLIRKSNELFYFEIYSYIMNEL